MIEGQEGVSWEQWAALAGACEEHGVRTLFRSDHYLNLDGQHPERGSLDAWGTICALAAVTSALRLGTLVSPATFRHPSVLAKLVATADRISGGRIELGLGAGWHDREHEAFGFHFPPQATRFEMLEEQLRVVLGSWTEDNYSFAGKHYSPSGLSAQPKPVQQPHPPLIVGGNAGRRSAALAARYAQEYNTPFPTLEDIERRRTRIEQACEQEGREPLPFSIMTGIVVGADPDDLRQRAQRLAELQGGDAQAFLSDPPSGWIVGTIDQAAEQLDAIRDAGVARVMCQQLLHDDLDAVALLGEELAPRVR